MGEWVKALVKDLATKSNDMSLIPRACEVEQISTNYLLIYTHTNPTQYINKCNKIVILLKLEGRKCASRANKNLCHVLSFSN